MLSKGPIAANFLNKCNNTFLNYAVPLCGPCLHLLGILLLNVGSLLHQQDQVLAQLLTVLDPPNNERYYISTKSSMTMIESSCFRMFLLSVYPDSRHRRTVLPRFTTIIIRIYIIHTICADLNKIGNCCDQFEILHKHWNQTFDYCLNKTAQGGDNPNLTQILNFDSEGKLLFVFINSYAPWIFLSPQYTQLLVY